uniref:Uncharacterized protein n=1 Tax=Rhizophora mucronata TaxID=61149 RepID=A0A2P2IPF6_RHIMU
MVKAQMPAGVLGTVMELIWTGSYDLDQLLNTGCGIPLIQIHTSDDQSPQAFLPYDKNEEGTVTMIYFVEHATWAYQLISSFIIPEVRLLSFAPSTPTRYRNDF